MDQTQFYLNRSDIPGYSQSLVETISYIRGFHSNQITLFALLIRLQWAQPGNYEMKFKFFAQLQLESTT